MGAQTNRRSIWFKGQMVPDNEATISVLSPTAQYGLNIFEGIRCYSSIADKGQLFAFRFSDHIKRLFSSCKLIGLAPPYNAHQIKDFLIETIRANRYHEDTAVRLTLFVEAEGSWSFEGPVTMFIAPQKTARRNPEALQGLRACVSSWERISDNCLPPRVKTGANYLNARYAHLEAKRHGYDLPLFLGRNGKMSEGGGACLFMLRNNVLTTPPLTSSVLESITRATVLQLATDLDIRVSERDIDRTELYLADEIFLCGSAAELSPITSLDGLPIGSAQPGEVTLSLLRRYLDVASNGVAAYSDWLLPIY